MYSLLTLDKEPAGLQPIVSDYHIGAEQWRRICDVEKKIYGMSDLHCRKTSKTPSIRTLSMPKSAYVIDGIALRWKTRRKKRKKDTLRLREYMV
jgi:hypothetical protein